MTEPPPHDKSEERVPVRPGPLQRNACGAAWIELHDEQDRFVIVWLREEEADLLHAALEEQEVAVPERVTAALQSGDGSAQWLWLYHRTGHAYRARVSVSREGLPEQEVDCLSADGLLLALRESAPIYVTGRLLESPAYGGYPPANWSVQPNPEPTGSLRIRRLRESPRDLLRHLARTLLAATAAAALVAAAVYTRVGWLAFVALVPASFMRLGHLWLAVRPETWEVGENSLLVERSFLGIRWRRRYLGATLHVTRSSRDWQSTIALTIERGGPGRRLAASMDGDDPFALGLFVAAYTGWKLVNHVAGEVAASRL
jgi:hypothetical protein